MAVHDRTLVLSRQRGLTYGIGPADIFPWPRTAFAMLWLDMTHAAESDYTYAYPQWRTERLLLDRAAALGADIRGGHEVTGLRQDETGVTVSVRAGDREYEARGAYLVGCDGADSVVRDLAGIEFPARTGGYYGVLGDVEVTAASGADFDTRVHWPGTPPIRSSSPAPRD